MKIFIIGLIIGIALMDLLFLLCALGEWKDDHEKR